MTWLPGLLALLLCQLAGEAISRVLHLPVPGPVIGLALMVAALLLAGGRIPAPVARASKALIGILSLLFVPAGVGLISLGPVVQGYTTALIVSMILSLVITLAVTALTFVAASRWQARRGERRGERRAGGVRP